MRPGPVFDVSTAVWDLLRRVRRLEARISQPRTRVQIQSWTLTENDDGDFIMRHKNGTTHTFPK